MTDTDETVEVKVRNLRRLHQAARAKHPRSIALNVAITETEELV